MFLLLVAQAVFQASPGPNAAAAAVGAMLTRWHYIALLAPLLLFALEWKRNRAIVIALLFAALILGATQGMVDLRIRAIRDGLPYGVSSLEPDDPIRRHFGMLHGMSMLLMAAQVLAATSVVLMNARKTVHVPEVEDEPSGAPPPPAAPVEPAIETDETFPG